MCGFVTGVELFECDTAFSLQCAFEGGHAWTQYQFDKQFYLNHLWETSIMHQMRHGSG